MLNLKQLALAIALTSSFGFAQKLVSVSCDPGSDVHVSYTDARGNEHNRIKNDANENGNVEVTVPTGSTKIKISKYSDGEWITYDLQSANQ